MRLPRLSRRIVAAVIPCVSLVASLPLVSCASAGASGNTSIAGHNSEIIEESELAGISAQTAYQAVQRLRPQFLNDRNTTPFGTPSGQAERNEALSVYLDAARLGGVDALNTIDISQVHEIRRLSPAEAMQRYGSRQMGTVIAVTLKH